MANILGVGIAAVDIVNVTDGYPGEDDEVRAESQSIRRGGNVTNTLVVLSQFGHQCQWLGTLADDHNSQIITQDLESHHIDFSQAGSIKGGITPTSYITLNKQTGSRTIVHYRDLPEPGAHSIEAVPLQNFQWVHFEGRNVIETRKMMDYVQRCSPSIPVSVEIEKPRDDLDRLFSGANVYFFSKAFALAQQFHSAVSLLDHFRAIIPDALLICTWGTEGAYALDSDQLLHAPATRIPVVVDTIGAGDTFNAGFIHAQLCKDSLQDSLAFACRLASEKCAMEGFTGLAQSLNG